MERIAIAGLTLRETDVAGLERLARPDRSGGSASSDGGAFVRELADGVAASEAVLLSTCNRVELVFAREAGHLPCRDDLERIATLLGLPRQDTLRERMHLECGLDAARRLFRIACSLDSLVVGEDQILAQVREAYGRSQELGLSGRLLGPLFQHAVQVGKEVRTRTELSRHPVSVVSIAVSKLAERFRSSAPRIGVIGAGKMGALVARSVREAGYPLALVVNRSLDGARALAREHGATAVALEEFRRASEPVDVLISATAAPGFVLDAATLLALAERTPASARLVAFDLAIPRDLEPLRHPSLEIVDLDQLRQLADENRKLRAAAAADAEALVEQKLETFARRFRSSALAAALEELSAESSAVLERELASLRTGRLARLSEDELAAVERWARTAFGRLAHVPIATLKGFAEGLAPRADDEGERDGEPFGGERAQGGERRAERTRGR